MRQKQDITAIIYDKRGRILSIGKNSYTKTHTLMFELGKFVGKPEAIYLHAEVDAILKCQDLDKAYSIFVSRTLKSGGYGNASPCSICQEAIRRAGIQVIKHT